MEMGLVNEEMQPQGMSARQAKYKEAVAAQVDIWVNQLWENYDIDDDGVIDREEARAFFKVALTQDRMQSGVTLDDFEEFDHFFNMADATKNGELSKSEMRAFLLKIVPENEIMLQIKIDRAERKIEREGEEDYVEESQEFSEESEQDVGGMAVNQTDD